MDVFASSTEAVVGTEHIYFHMKYIFIYIYKYISVRNIFAVEFRTCGSALAAFF